MSERTRLQVGDVALEVRWIEGACKHDVTFVLLHEGLGCAALWKDFPEQLNTLTGCSVLAYSRAGYGASDPVELPRPLTYMHHEGLEVLPRLLDVAALQKVVLVGHSDGGSIALINAGGCQDPRVFGLALMAPHVFNEELSVASIRKARIAYETTNLRDKLARYHGDNVDIAFWGWNAAWLDPGFENWNIEEYLPRIRIPTLIMQGRADQYGTPAQIEAIERQVAGPVQTCWFDDCGHVPFQDQPQRSLDAIHRFLIRHDLSKAGDVCGFSAGVLSRSRAE